MSIFLLCFHSLILGCAFSHEFYENVSPPVISTYMYTNLPLQTSQYDSILPSTPSPSLGAKPHPDGGNQEPITTDSINQPVAPGRDIFEDKMKDHQPKSSTIAQVEHEDVKAGMEQASIKIMDEAGKKEKEKEGIEAPPPLPPREQADLTTTAVEQQAVVEENKDEKVIEGSSASSESASSTVTESAAVQVEEERIRKELYPEDA